MAKKAAALQSFQKCDVGNLAIPSTIVEDSELRPDIGDAEPSPGGSEAGDRARFVFLETQSDISQGLVPGHLREPSDKIEIALSPVR